MVGSFGRKPIRAESGQVGFGPLKASQRPSQFADRQQSVLQRFVLPQLGCLAAERDAFALGYERATFELLRVIWLRQRDQQGSTHIPAGVPPRQAMGFRAKLTGS